MSLQGIDCASTIVPSVAAALKQQGIDFVGRYLGSGWKGLQKAEADIITAAGLKIISIWETSPTDVSYFTESQAKADTTAAVSYAKAIGQPAGTAIYFTVDFNASITDLPAVLVYFNALKTSIGPDYKVGAYGDYSIIEGIHTAGAADYFMQTYAWSAGKEASDFIHVYQYLNDVVFAGIGIDHDEILKDPGAWGADVAQPTNVVVPIPAPPAPKPAPPAPKPIVVPATYAVQPGDSLSGICAHFGLNIATVQAYNHIANPDYIYIGQILHLTSPIPVPAPQPSYVGTYVIQSGDTLSGIALKFNTTVTVLENLNGIANADKIYAGETIKIPSHTAPVQPAAPTTYQIVSGDTLEGIAARFHTTVSALMQLNHIQNKDLIYAGQVIRLR